MIYNEYLKMSLLKQIISFKWVVSFVCLALVSLYSSIQIQKLSLETGKYFNIMDVFFYQFGLYMYIFLFLAPIFIALMSNIPVDLRIDNYIYSRFPIKRNIWFNKILLLAMITFIFVLMATLINLFIGISSMNISFKWSEGGTFLNGLTSLTDIHYISESFFEKSPIFTLFITITLLFCYLFFLGMVSMIATFLFKRAFYGFIVSIILNFCVLATFKIDYLFKNFHFLPYQKLLLTYQKPVFQLNMSDSLSYTFLYWFVIIAATITLSVVIFQRSDYIFEVKDND